MMTSQMSTIVTLRGVGRTGGLGEEDECCGMGRGL